MGSTPRTLTQMLRERDDSEVGRLLEMRPDLAFPPPTDFSQVASRATTRHSVAEALHLLTVFELWVAAQASLRPTAFTAADLVTDGAAVEDVEAAVHRLLDLALLWGDMSSLRPVRAMAGLLPDDAPSDLPPQRPPTFETNPRQSPAVVDKVAAGSAFEFVRRLDVLVEHCDHLPAKLVRTGGLASRDLRALASLLDLPTAVATVHLEIARCAGLLGTSVRGSDEFLLPTADFDAWQRKSLADQWVWLVQAWMFDHAPSGPAWLKRVCLRAFGDPQDAVVLTLGDLRTWLAWHRPRRHASADRELAAMLEQSAWLGITGLGARSSFMSSDGTQVRGEQVAEMFPPRVDHVLVQADLTAIAPGPLSPDAARDLGALADVESRGGATVYRISLYSLQRAQRLGWSGEDMIETLSRLSTTPLPQPLTYLISDLSRPGRSPTGAVAYERPVHRHGERAVTAQPHDARTGGSPLGDDAIASILAALRHDDPDDGAGVSERTSDTVFNSPALTLREAVETGEPVWFGQVDTRGVSAERVVTALAVEGGRLTARDVKTQEHVSIALHRITAAHIMRPGDSLPTLPTPKDPTCTSP
jgi:hypothetical protein